MAGNDVDGVTNAVVAVTLMSSTLSIGGGVFLLVTHFKIKELIKNKVRQLLRFLTFADVFVAVGYFIASIRYIILGLDPKERSRTDYLCIAQSFITTLFSLSSFFWTTIIAIHLFRLVMLRKNANISIVYHVIAWAVPSKYQTESLIHKLWITNKGI